jgi:hypothetical protein
MSFIQTVHPLKANSSNRHNTLDCNTIIALHNPFQEKTIVKYFILDEQMLYIDLLLAIGMLEDH